MATVQTVATTAAAISSIPVTNQARFLESSKNVRCLSVLVEGVVVVISVNDYLKKNIVYGQIIFRKLLI